MIKRSTILNNGRTAVVLFVILIIFLTASLALASDKALTAQDVLPSNCSEGIVNGGFEERTGWTTPGTNYSAGYETDLDLVRTGASSMRTGIVNPAHEVYSYSSAYQTVTLPKDATKITLSFWLLPQTEEPESIPIYLPQNDPFNIREEDVATTSDWQFVFLYNKYGQELERLLYRRQDSDVWIYHTFDLTKYANEPSIRVYFDTYNNGWGGVTSMHIDDVSLEICTGTPPPDPDGTITGTVSLQGRTDHSGAQVCADDGGSPVCVTSDAAGAYSIDVEEGTYSVTVGMERYLDAVKLNVPVTAGNATTLAPVTCLGGDTNDDCVINILDMSLVGGRFGMSCGDSLWDDRADVNDDCTINILDLTVTGGNFGNSCPVPWS